MHRTGGHSSKAYSVKSLKGHQYTVVCNYTLNSAEGKQHMYVWVTLKILCWCIQDIQNIQNSKGTSVNYSSSSAPLLTASKESLSVPCAASNYCHNSAFFISLATVTFQTNFCWGKSKRATTVQVRIYLSTYLTCFERLFI